MNKISQNWNLLIQSKFCIKYFHVLLTTCGVRLVPILLKGRHTRWDWSHRVNWQLVPATSCRDQSHCVNYFKIQSQRPTLVPATTGSPTNSKSLQLDFAAKKASSHDVTSPCNLLQGLVPSCVPTLIRHLPLATKLGTFHPAPGCMKVSGDESPVEQ